MIYFYSEASLRKFYEDNKAFFCGDLRVQVWNNLAKDFAVAGVADLVTVYCVKDGIDGTTGAPCYDGDVHTWDGLRRVGTNVIMIPCNRQNRNKSAVSFVLADSLSRDWRVARYFKFDLPEPNRVGKATAKKLLAWFDYLVAEREAENEYINKAKNARQNYIDKAHALGYKFDELTNEKAVIRTAIFTLRVSFSESGRISERMEYTGRNNIDALAQMPTKLR